MMFVCFVLFFLLLFCGGGVTCCNCCGAVDFEFSKCFLLFSTLLFILFFFECMFKTVVFTCFYLFLP